MTCGRRRRDICYRPLLLLGGMAMMFVSLLPLAWSYDVNIPTPGRIVCGILAGGLLLGGAFVALHSYKPYPVYSPTEDDWDLPEPPEGHSQAYYSNRR